MKIQSNGFKWERIAERYARVSTICLCLCGCAHWLISAANGRNKAINAPQHITHGTHAHINRSVEIIALTSSSPCALFCVLCVCVYFRVACCVHCALPRTHYIYTGRRVIRFLVSRVQYVRQRSNSMCALVYLLYVVHMVYSGAYGDIQSMAYVAYVQEELHDDDDDDVPVYNGGKSTDCACSVCKHSHCTVRLCFIFETGKRYKRYKRNEIRTIRYEAKKKCRTYILIQLSDWIEWNHIAPAAYMNIYSRTQRHKFSISLLNSCRFRALLIGKMNAARIGNSSCVWVDWMNMLAQRNDGWTV